MPFYLQQGHPACPAGKPWGVVNMTTRKIVDCHTSKAEGKTRLRALYASEHSAQAAATLIVVSHADAEGAWADPALVRQGAVATEPFAELFTVAEYPPPEWFDYDPKWCAQ